MDYPNPSLGISKEGALSGGGIRPEWARLPAPAEPGGETGLPPEVCGQLGLIQNSQNLMMLSIVGLAIQYRSLDVQRRLLLDSAAQTGAEDADSPASQAAPPACSELCEPKSMQLAASLLILASLLGFQQQANCLAAQSAAAGVCDFLEPKLNATAILIALIRYFKLLQSGQRQTGESGEAAELAETEALTEPIL